MQASVEKLAPLALRVIGKGEDAFVGPPAPLARPRRMSGVGEGLKMLLDTADEFQRMRAALEATRLGSETARAMSRKKWLPHDTRKAQALQHVANKQLPNKTAEAWEVVDYLQKTFGKSIAFKTVYDEWLPPRRRRRKVE